MNNFLTRTLVGSAVGVVVIAATVAGWWAFYALLATIGVLAVWELARLKAGRWSVWIVISLLLLGLFYYLWGAWSVLWYIFIIWASDVGAYLVGTAVGRHKLAPKVSPHKTWEGAVGGLLAGVAMGIWAADVQGHEVWLWIGLAVTAVVTGILGDLGESVLKRRAGVKDSSRLLPGHGGVLDRFDSLLFSAPFVFIYFLIFG